MNIALDYDGTYTRDPEAWDQFIELMQRQGHTVYCVTMRYRNYEMKEVLAALESKVDGIFFTERKAKQPFMFARGISIDVWVDDNPFWVNTDAAE